MESTLKTYIKLWVLTTSNGYDCITELIDKNNKKEIFLVKFKDDEYIEVILYEVENYYGNKIRDVLNSNNMSYRTRTVIIDPITGNEYENDLENIDKNNTRLPKYVEVQEFTPSDYPEDDNNGVYEENSIMVYYKLENSCKRMRILSDGEQRDKGFEIKCLDCGSTDAAEINDYDYDCDDNLIDLGNYLTCNDCGQSER